MIPQSIDDLVKIKYNLDSEPYELPPNKKYSLDAGPYELPPKKAEDPLAGAIDTPTVMDHTELSPKQKVMLKRADHILDYITDEFIKESVHPYSEPDQLRFLRDEPTVRRDLLKYLRYDLQDQVIPDGYGPLKKSDPNVIDDDNLYGLPKAYLLKIIDGKVNKLKEYMKKFIKEEEAKEEDRWNPKKTYIKYDPKTGDWVEWDPYENKRKK